MFPTLELAPKCTRKYLTLANFSASLQVREKTKKPQGHPTSVKASWIRQLQQAASDRGKQWHAEETELCLVMSLLVLSPRQINMTKPEAN